MIDTTSLKNAFSKEINGKQTSLNFIENSNGVKIGICNYGARITHFLIPQENKEDLDIVLGFGNIEDYLKDNFYHGATIGRFANRIKQGKFEIDGKDYQLEINNGPNALHGGKGLQTKVWDINSYEKNAISLSVFSKDGDDGYPGNLKVNVTFKITDHDELVINYAVKSDQKTILNITNHAYFNLNGENEGNILNHKVIINADYFVASDQNAIPLGGLTSVKNTPFDFRTAKQIEADIYENNQQLTWGNGYDHSYHLHKEGNELSFAASSIGDKTGIKLEVLTTQPAMQFYTGNFLGDGSLGKSGNTYYKRNGFCFETQNHPDSPNHPEFPSSIIEANEEFQSTTIFKIIK